MIKFKNITHKYNKEIFKDLNIELPEKGMVVLTGKSGSGKTTFLNILYGLVKPSKGKIIVSPHISMAYDHSLGILLDNKTVIENIHCALNSRNQAFNKAEVTKVLDNLKILKFKHKKVSELSTGQKKRVSIARAYLLKSEVYIFDEPFSLLDVDTTQIVYRLLKDKSKNSLVICSTHSTKIFDTKSERSKSLSNEIEMNMYFEKQTDNKDKVENTIIERNSKSKMFINFKSNFYVYLLISLLLIINIFTISFKQNQQNDTRNKNYIDENILVLLNTEKDLLGKYDQVFNYEMGHLQYTTFNLNVFSNVIALPVSVLDDTIELMENEIILGHAYFNSYEDKSFKSLGIDKPSDLINKEISFNNNIYKVKNIVENNKNTIYMNDRLLKTFVTNDLRVFEWEDEVKLLSGSLPKQNDKYIEIVTHYEYNIGDIIEEKYKVSGITVDGKTYMNPIEFREKFLKENYNLLLYSKNKEADKIFLDISSISYNDIYNDNELLIESNLSEIEKQYELVWIVFNIIFLVTILIRSILNNIRIRKEFIMRMFLKESYFKLIKSSLKTILFEIAMLIICFCINYFLVGKFITHIYNWNYFLSYQTFFRCILSYCFVFLLSNIIVYVIFNIRNLNKRILTTY